MYEYPDCVLFWLILCTHIINWELLRKNDAVKKGPSFRLNIQQNIERSTSLNGILFTKG